MSYSPSPSSNPPTPLSQFFTSAQQGSLSQVQALVSEGKVSPNDRDADNVSALHWAAINNHIHVVQHLLHVGAEVDAIGGELKSTPLHWAVRQGHVGVVGVLVKSGASLTATDSQGFAALHLAAQYGHMYLALYFLVLGADVDILDRDRRTPMMWAVYKGLSAELVPLFIKFGANVDLVDVISCSALHWAALKGNRIACAQLVKAGANTEGKDNKSLTPLGCAQEKGHADWFQRILRDHQIEKSRFNKESRKKMVHLMPFVIIPFMFVTFEHLPWYLWFLLMGGMVYSVRKLLDYINGLTPLVQTPFQTAIFQASFSLVGLIYFNTIIWATAEHILLNAFLLFLAFLVIYFLPKTTLSDPGFIPLPNVSSLKNVVVDLLEKDKLDRRFFCPTCLVRKPLRSKHDRETDRCVALFDHYCPWVFNVVGVNNHRSFLIFLASATFAQVFYIALSVFYLMKETDFLAPVEPSCVLPWNLCNYFAQHPYVTFSIFWCSLNGFWQSLTLFAQVFQISYGTLTNEQVNVARYDYLFEIDPLNPAKRIYKNPFDMGFFANWSDFCLGTGSNSKINWFELYEVPKAGHLYP